MATIGSLGDLHPKLAIALELRQRGHDVAFATHREYRDKIESLGFEFHRMRPDNTALSDPQEMAKMMDLTRGTEYVIRHWIGAHLRETYEDLVAIASGADCMVAGEGVVAARIVAEQLGMPWALAVLQPASFLSAYDPSVIPVFPWLANFRRFGSILNRGIVRLSKAIANRWAEPVHQLRSELGLPPLIGNPFIDDKYSSFLVLALFSPVFASPQPDWAATTIQTGFPFFDDGSKLSAELQRFLDAGEPPIVFTLGSAAVMTPGTFFRESIRVVERLKRRAVLLMGRNPLPQQLPLGVMALGYVPHNLLFPQACAIVHQGGVGTTAAALRAGRPTLVMPYSHDQPDNAARVKRLGTSLSIARQRYSAKLVGRKLGQLLDDPQYAASAERVAGLIARERGVDAACNAIEQKLCLPLR